MDKLNLTHLEENTPLMVDVSKKPQQERTAIASGKIILSKTTITFIKENKVPKGKVIEIAEIAGIMAAKRTPDLIPLCHPLLLTKIKVKGEIFKNGEEEGIEITSTVKNIGQTGVEIEALMSVQVALLTIYDMCKAIDKKMIIKDVKLIEKTKHDL